MKKKAIMVLSVFVLLVVSAYIIHALTNSNEIIKVTKTGETTHGSYEVDVRETNLPDTSGYLGSVNLNVDSGYYISNFTATYKGQALQFGFEAGSEHGAFFRESNYSPYNDEYQFLIPQELVDADTVSNDDKIQVTIEISKKKPIDITYGIYTKNTYEDEVLYNPENYEGNNVLVSNYMDGDIVLPDNCTNNGCLLKLQFANHDDYSEYKNVDRGEGFDQWIYSRSRLGEDDHFPMDTLVTGEDACDDENNSCYVVVRKEFKDLSQASLSFGYTDIHVFSTNFIGFGVSGDVQNFEDIFRETGSDFIAFNSNNMENDVELFYGTKTLKLTKTQINPIVNEGATNNCANVGDFDNVTGSGYGYEVSYNNSTGVATVSIDSYYQDQMTLELTITKNEENVLPGTAKVNLHRFAFSGNGGELLTVDSEGRNCGENNNGNTCSEGEYYSTQYRGVLSAFYVNKNTQPTTINSVYDIENLFENSMNLRDHAGEKYYKRDESFNPHAIALFYNNDDMIVKTKDFDLNSTVKVGGLIKKSDFNTLYDGYTLKHYIQGTNDLEDLASLDRDYARATIDNVVPIKYIDYFGDHLEESIMHDLVLISKDEVRQLGIVKIALFLVNGEVEESAIPSLTYGTDEGKVMYIREDGE